jgi:hypothetical protein
MFGQTKQVNVSQNDVIFKNSWLTNKFNHKEENFETYRFESMNFGVEPLTNQQTDPTIGFLHY